MRHGQAQFLAQHVQGRNRHVVVAGKEGVGRIVSKQPAHRLLRAVKVVMAHLAAMQRVAQFVQAVDKAAFAFDAGR
ncbi:hypothetical protein D3C81_2090560 [compost metagenome]